MATTPKTWLKKVQCVYGVLPVLPRRRSRVLHGSFSGVGALHLPENSLRPAQDGRHQQRTYAYQNSQTHHNRHGDQEHL